MSAKSLVLCLLKKNPGDAIKSLDWELIAARVGWGRGRKGDRLGWHKFCFFCLFDEDVFSSTCMVDFLFSDFLFLVQGANISLGSFLSSFKWLLPDSQWLLLLVETIVLLSHTSERISFSWLSVLESNCSTEWIKLFSWLLLFAIWGRDESDVNCAFTSWVAFPKRLLSVSCPYLCPAPLCLTESPKFWFSVLEELVVMGRNVGFTPIAATFPAAAWAAILLAMFMYICVGKITTGNPVTLASDRNLTLPVAGLFTIGLDISRLSDGLGRMGRSAFVIDCSAFKFGLTFGCWCFITSFMIFSLPSGDIDQ